MNWFHSINHKKKEKFKQTDLHIKQALKDGKTCIYIHENKLLDKKDTHKFSRLSSFRYPFFYFLLSTFSLQISNF